MNACTVRFTLNDQAVVVTGPPMRRLLDVLREDLNLTGSREGCGEGECGACSVILNGELTNSCLVPLVQVDGVTVMTVEGVTRTRLGQAVQQAFVTHGGTQCGICTPGMVMAAWWLAENRRNLPAGGLRLEKGPAGAVPPADGVTVRDLLAGNLCRCTGYDLIVASVEAALAATDRGEPG